MLHDFSLVAFFFFFCTLDLVCPTCMGVADGTCIKGSLSVKTQDVAVMAGGVRSARVGLGCGTMGGSTVAFRFHSPCLGQVLPSILSVRLVFSAIFPLQFPMH